MLGDVSGKGVSAALLVSVLQGAIRSSTSSRHESACGRINRMLCELTARARFATLFWGLYDAESGTLRYVNAGHAAPILVRHGQNRIERLDQGGPVLGLLPSARYSAGSVKIEGPDTLILYSDGVNEAANENEEEFGEDRVKEMISHSEGAAPAELCDRIMSQRRRVRERGTGAGRPHLDGGQVSAIRGRPVAPGTRAGSRRGGRMRNRGQTSTQQIHR